MSIVASRLCIIPERRDNDERCLDDLTVGYCRHSFNKYREGRVAYAMRRLLNTQIYQRPHKHVYTGRRKLSSFIEEGTMYNESDIRALLRYRIKGTKQMRSIKSVHLHSHGHLGFVAFPPDGGVPHTSDVPHDGLLGQREGEVGNKHSEEDLYCLLVSMRVRQWNTGGDTD